MEYKICAVYDAEVIKISNDILLYYLEDNKSLSFIISINKVEQIISKNFYVNVKALEIYPVCKGRMYRVMTSDGDTESMWEF